MAKKKAAKPKGSRKALKRQYASALQKLIFAKKFRKHVIRAEGSDSGSSGEERTSQLARLQRSVKTKLPRSLLKSSLKAIQQEYKRQGQSSAFKKLKKKLEKNAVKKLKDTSKQGRVRRRALEWAKHETKTAISSIPRLAYRQREAKRTQEIKRQSVDDEAANTVIQLSSPDAAARWANFKTRDVTTRRYTVEVVAPGTDIGTGTIVPLTAEVMSGIDKRINMIGQDPALLRSLFREMRVAVRRNDASDLLKRNSYFWATLLASIHSEREAATADRVKLVFRPLKVGSSFSSLSGAGLGTRNARRVNGNRSNGFFPYWVNNEKYPGLDLSRWQIYSQNNYPETQENCVFHSLILAGIEEEEFEPLEMLKLKFSNRVSLPNVRLIAETLKRRIIVRGYYNTPTCTQTRFRNNAYGPKNTDQDTITIAAVAGHAFLDEFGPCTLFYLKNPARCEELAAASRRRNRDNDRAICKLPYLFDSEDGRYATKGAKMSRIVRFLVDNINECDTLLPIDFHRVVPIRKRPNTFQEGVILKQTDFVFEEEEEDDSEGEKTWNKKRRHREKNTLATIKEYGFTCPEPPTKVFALDIESDIQDEAGYHVPILVGVVEVDFSVAASDAASKQVSIFQGEDCVVQAFSFMSAQAANHEDEDEDEKKKKRKKATVVVYIHNLRYDLAMIQQFVPITKVCKKGTTRYSADFFDNQARFTLIDSLRLLPFSLKAFPKTLGLPDTYCKKEFISYAYYNHDNINGGLFSECSIWDYAATLRNADDEKKQSFVEGLRSSLEKDPVLFDYDVKANTFDPVAYYKYYLRWDVWLLAAGIVRLQELLNDLARRFGIADDLIPQVPYLLTITSIGKRLFQSAGVYQASNGNPVYALAGKLREYVHETVIGGRVMVSLNTPRHVVEESLYIDGRSLYPSAVQYITASPEQGGIGLGFPMLAPELIDQEYLVNNRYLHDDRLRVAFPWFTVTIEVTKINKRAAAELPSFYYRDEKTKNPVYSNTLPNGGDPVTVTVDQGTLRSWIEFHDIEFTTKQGLWWPANPHESKQQKMGEIVAFLYNERLKYKKEKNSGMSQLCKLIMNAVSYGANIPKMATLDVKMKTPDEINGFLYNNFFDVYRARRCGLMYEVELHQMDHAATLCKWGAMVLSYSKYLMDRLFYFVGNCGAVGRYTDTDSVVFPKAVLEQVTRQFEQSTSLPFMGPNLLSFHSEFELEDARGKPILDKLQRPAKAVTEPCAVESFYLGKKLYFHLVVAYSVFGVPIVACKYSAKGFTIEGLIEKGLELLQVDIDAMTPQQKQLAEIYGLLEVYKIAAEGGELEIDLFPPSSEKTRFVYEFGVGVKTPDTQFTRTFRCTRTRGPYAFTGANETQDERDSEDINDYGDETDLTPVQQLLATIDRPAIQFKHDAFQHEEHA